MFSCLVKIVNIVAVAVQSVVHVNYSIVSGLFKCVGHAIRVMATVVGRLTHAGVDVFYHLLQLVGEVTVFSLSAVRLLYSCVLFVGHLASLLVGGVETIALWFANVLPAALRLIWSCFTCAGNQLAAMFTSVLRVLSFVGLHMYELCAIVASYTSAVVAQIAHEASKNIGACFETVTYYSALAGVNTICALKQTCAYVESVFETPVIQVRLAVLPVVNYTRTWIVFNCMALLLVLLMLTTLLLIIAMSRKLSKSQTLRHFMFPSFYNHNMNVQPPIDDMFDGSDDERAVDQPLAFNNDTPSEISMESITESDVDSLDVSEMESTDFSSTEDDFDDENDENNQNVVNIQLPEPRIRARTPSVLSKLADKTNYEEVGRILESERDKRLCVVCQDQEKSVLMLPCKHMCLCVNCAHSIASSRTRMRRICPLCRAPFHTVMNVYV